MNHYPIYLDNNATTPCDPWVLQEMLPYFTEHPGNPASRAHVYGWTAEEAIEQARERVAVLIKARSTEIIFTSGATESVSLAIRGLAEGSTDGRKHIITIATEHRAVLDTCAFLKTKGCDITVLPVDANGGIDMADLERSIRSDTLLVAMMYANNETGVVMPVDEVGRIARDRGVLFFCDATQAFGKWPIDISQDHIDLMAFSGHKLYGPKGIGGLYIRSEAFQKSRIVPLQFGGGHEGKLRSGTLNVPGIVGLGMASEVASKKMFDESARMKNLRDRLYVGIQHLPDLSWNGSSQLLLPHVLHVTFGFRGGEKMLARMSKQIAAASGSACSSASTEPSHVLKAMGLSDTSAWASVRFSLGRFTQDAEIEDAIDIILESAESCMH